MNRKLTSKHIMWKKKLTLSDRLSLILLALGVAIFALGAIMANSPIVLLSIAVLLVAGVIYGIGF